jgi:SAM-dependent methyltransferase
MTLAPVESLARIPDSVCDKLRVRLGEQGYTDRALGISESIAPGMFDCARLPLVYWALGKKGDAASNLSLLFAYAGAVPDSSARAALGDDIYGALREAGVLYDAGESKTRSAFRVLPADGLYVLADEPAAGREAVMGPGPTTMELLRLMPASIGGAVLDLGCGAGTIALAAARRGASLAVGTDLNSRAVSVARFNARLNGLAAEFCAGDLYEPTGGVRFDLVVAQPPYVVKPSETPTLTYLHGGPAGDEIVLRTIAGAPAALAPGGRALFLVDSAVRPGEPLHVRLRACLGGAPVDLLVLAAPGASPDLQAIAYGSLECPAFGSDYDAAVLRYRRHLDALGVTEFRHALVVLRAGRSPGQRESFTVALPVRSLAKTDGAMIDTAFEALDLASRGDDVIAAAAVRASSQARWVEERPRPDPSLEPVHSIRFSAGALGTDREITEAGYALFAALEEAPTVELAIEKYAELCETTPAEVRRKVLDFVREGLARGLLEPRPPSKSR